MLETVPVGPPLARCQQSSRTFVCAVILRHHRTVFLHISLQDVSPRLALQHGTLNRAVSARSIPPASEANRRCLRRVFGMAFSAPRVVRRAGLSEQDPPLPCLQYLHSGRRLGCRTPCGASIVSGCRQTCYATPKSGRMAHVQVKPRTPSKILFCDLVSESAARGEIASPRNGDPRLRLLETPSILRC